MRFHPSEEQLAIQDALRGTLGDTLPAERLRTLIDEPVEIDRPSWEALMALGLGGIAMPEAAGGSGLGLLDLAMAVEVLGQGAAVGPVVQHLLVGLAATMPGASSEAAPWLEGLASGETVATLALGGGWLPESWDVAFEGGRVSGSVRFVPGAAAAALFAVGVAGGGIVLVQAGEGVEITPVRSADRSRKLSTIRFENAPAVPLLAAGQDVERLFDAALVLGAADALGGAQYCLDLSVDYAKQREQFGQPIGRFQALKHQLATMALSVEPARALLWYAGHAYDARLPDARRSAAMAKAHISDRFVAVARDAIAAHGGIGYTWEYSLNTWFRRALFDRAYLGSPAVHRARAADMAGW